MRIGAFEVDCIFRETVSIAEIITGQAPLLRAVHLENVRGQESDCLRFYAVIDGYKTNRKSIKELPFHQAEVAAYKEKELRTGLLLPASLPPGKHSGELHIDYEKGKHSLPFSLEVLPASWIPTDLAHAFLLAAWVPSINDTIRGYAANALRGIPQEMETPLACVQALYEALKARNLLYQPVPTIMYPDFQPVSDLNYVLQSGGSCADLSLLFAALLWQRGYSPALLIYEEHMTAGCFSVHCPLDQEIVEDKESILRLIREGNLILPEVTDVCGAESVSFQASREHALANLQRADSGCCLIHPSLLLRNGTVRAVSPATEEDRLICPRCGFDHVPSPGNIEEIRCPACGNQFHRKKYPNRSSVGAEPIAYDPSVLRYGHTSHGTGVLRLLAPGVSAVRILPRWQNQPVASIGTHAFESSYVKWIQLPPDITVIEDRAFRNCENLEHIELPEDLTLLGSGAFSGSGLVSIQIPDSLLRIPILAFANCRNLATVTLSEGLLAIDDFAFQHCPKLKRVYIPSSVRFVSKSAFDPGCVAILSSESTKWK